MKFWYVPALLLCGLGTVYAGEYTLEQALAQQSAENPVSDPLSLSRALELAEQRSEALRAQKAAAEAAQSEAVAAGVVGDEKVFELLTHGTRAQDSQEADPQLARDEAEKSKKRYGAPDALADINNSMNAAWSIVEFLPRKIPRTSFSSRFKIGKIYWPLFDHRRVPEGAKLHEAVIERQQKRRDYKPPNLPKTYEVVKTRSVTGLDQ